MRAIKAKSEERELSGVLKGLFCSAYPFANILSFPSCCFASFNLHFPSLPLGCSTQENKVSILSMLMLRRGGNLHIVVHLLSRFLCPVTTLLYSRNGKVEQAYEKRVAQLPSNEHSMGWRRAIKPQYKKCLVGLSIVCARRKVKGEIWKEGSGVLFSGNNERTGKTRRPRTAVCRPFGLGKTSRVSSSPSFTQRSLYFVRPAECFGEGKTKRRAIVGNAKKK